MLLLGLTGGIGMGKSTAAGLFQALQVPTVDTDTLARQVVEPGQPALEEIERTFGRSMIAPDGRLRREELARRVFAEPQARRQLEAILHPRIRVLWQAQAEQWRAESQPVGVIVIPLLYETDAASHFNAVICVACSAATQQERLFPRGWPESQLAQRLAAQWPIEKKMSLADYVVWTEGLLEVHAAQLKRILSVLMGKETSVGLGAFS